MKLFLPSYSISVVLVFASVNVHAQVFNSWTFDQMQTNTSSPAAGARPKSPQVERYGLTVVPTENEATKPAVPVSPTATKVESIPDGAINKLKTIQ
jgi:hypothetical protein